MMNKRQTNDEQTTNEQEQTTNKNADEVVRNNQPWRVRVERTNDERTMNKQQRTYKRMRKKDE
jgi:hypothetical protein